MAGLKRLYVQNVDGWQKTLLQKRFLDKELEVKVVEHGIVLPARKIDGFWKGGVCDSNFNFIAGYKRVKPPGVSKDWWASVESAYDTGGGGTITQLNEDVIFGGVLINLFGHFIAESFNRLWYVVKNPESQLKILFIVFGSTCKSWANSFLELMGVNPERIIYVEHPTQCRSVTIPEQSQYAWAAFTKEYVFPYWVIKSRVIPSKAKKIYLTRTDIDAKRSVRPNWSVCCFNEKYFQDFFVKQGFEVVYMEKLSIEEQISIVMGADEIATTLGTLAHWAIFCKPTVKLITLTRTKEVLIAHSFLVEAFNISNYYIIDGYRNFMYAKHDTGAIIFGSNKYWKEFVADYFGEQIDEDDDISYLEDSLDKYVDFWCRKYQDPKHLDIWVESLSKMCRRIIELEREASKNRPLLNYQTHIAKKGWSNWNSEGSFSNSLDQKLDIQAIKIDFPNHNVYYAVYFNDAEGWSAEVSNSQQAGTTGKSKPITGIQIRLDEAGTKEFDIFYRVHTFDGAWTPWAKNGEALYSQGVKLNSIQIELKPKAENGADKKER